VFSYQEVHAVKEKAVLILVTDSKEFITVEGAKYCKMNYLCGSCVLCGSIALINAYAEEMLAFYAEEALAFYAEEALNKSTAEEVLAFYAKDTEYCKNELPLRFLRLDSW
jgi:hypothetical protein